MYRVCLFMGLLVFLINGLYAQQNYQQWLEKDRRAFKNYLEEQDKAFLEFLKADWEAFKAMQGMTADKEPKPVKMPIAPEPEPVPQPEPQPEKEPDVPEAPRPEEEPAPCDKPEKTLKKQKPTEELDVPELPKPEPPSPVPPPPPVDEQKPELVFEYFDKPYKVNTIENVRMDFGSRIDNKKIAATWEIMARSNYKSTLQQLQAHATGIRLNDWGRLTFFHAFTKKMFPGNTNQQLIADWFLLTKAGYRIKLCYQGNQLLLLVPPKQLLYEIPYVELDGTKYYFIGFDNKFRSGEQVYTYRGSHEAADASIDLSLTVLPRITAEKKEKKLRFNYAGKDITVAFLYTMDVVQFLADYPQTELFLYFQSNPTESFQASLVSSLAPYVEDKTELEAVNFLLRFAQTAFAYETDDRQFGREKYLLPEETIYYPKSDCEDRSILFAFLVKRLLGSEILVLDYPGHVCTAINLDHSPGGDHIVYQGKRYAVCDPTYINAVAGMTLPRFKSTQPKVIEYN